MRTLILGVGSSILSDDAVGIVVARKLGELLGGRDDVDIAVNEEGGFSLLEDSLGYDRLVVIDSMVDGREPGSLRRFGLSNLSRTIHASSPHGANLATVMELGRKQGLAVPGDVIVYGITIADALTFGEGLTPELAARVDGIVAAIAAEAFG